MPTPAQYKPEEKTKAEYEQIILELKAGKEDTGRPINLTLESFREFLYWFQQTELEYWSAAKAGWSQSSYKRYKEGSETFRSVLSRDEFDLEAVARENIARAVRGVPMKKDDEGKIIQQAIPPDLETSKWYLMNKKRKEEEKQSDGPVLGAPKNEREADLLLRLVNKHHDYVEAKRSNDQGTGTVQPA